MPIYEYVCENCHYIFEVFRQRLGDEETRCPRCGAAEAKRLISRPGQIGTGRPSSSCGTSWGIG